MKKIKKTPNVKMNLSLDKDFYLLLQERAKNDYMRVATWTKQYLMKSLLEKNNSDYKCLTNGGVTM
jgi:hypothetical protein